MNLVIVESPTKAKTISKFLGKDYKVASSFGHIRDLPKSRIGVDVENNFEPHYLIPKKARPHLKELKAELKNTAKVILASDEDREGEAIAWHIIKALSLDELKNKKEKGKKIEVERIVFHEITESAIKDALLHPRSINMNLVDAQQARRVLDRLVGYNLSPFLWKKVMNRLSAGRVQSVALRLITEREKEIQQFIPQEYWTISVILSQDTRYKIQDTRKLQITNSPKSQKSFEADLAKINDKTIEKLDIKTKDEADKIAADLEKAKYKITKISKRELKKNPLPPFTTSTLQQESSRRLRFTPKQTMRFAQILYENGIITYMRTDSVNLSKESVETAKNWIEKELGKEYAVNAPRFFKTKSKLAQEAHEAIRPTRPPIDVARVESSFNVKLEPSVLKIYDLIWRRFIASQLPQAKFDSVSVDIEAKNPRAENSNIYLLKANGSTMQFDGYMKIWKTQYQENELPELKDGEELDLEKVIPSQHFTEPPARYNDASLIKALEEYGIGRPSTYVPIISVIQDRNYVFKNEASRLQPTEIGIQVSDLLTKHFPDVVDIDFTARMEEKLDKIAAARQKWQRIISEFYQPFKENLDKKYEEVKSQKPKTETTDQICEKCGKQMLVKFSRFGKFFGCSGFPDCRNAKTYIDKNTFMCPKCGKGAVIKRKTKRGRYFFGCSAYPDCDFASWKNPAAEAENFKEDEEG
jgi:DNA topoisomerase-1